jgi:hypothetical protein
MAAALDGKHSGPVSIPIWPKSQQNRLFREALFREPPDPPFLKSDQDEFAQAGDADTADVQSLSRSFEALV